MTLVTSFTVNWGIMDVGTMRELALQISGISKIVNSGGGHRQATAVEPGHTPAERPQDEPAGSR